MLLLSCIAMARFTITGEHGIAGLFNLIVANGGAGITGKALAAILAVGAAYVADPDRHPLIFWVTVVLCVVALASAMTMLVLLGDETLARHLYDWAPSGIDEATAYGKAANLMLGGFIAWVLGVAVGSGRVEAELTRRRARRSGGERMKRATGFMPLLAAVAVWCPTAIAQTPGGPVNHALRGRRAPGGVDRLQRSAVRAGLMPRAVGAPYSSSAVAALQGVPKRRSGRSETSVRCGTPDTAWRPLPIFRHAQTHRTDSGH